MITAVTGKLRSVGNGRAELAMGPLLLELLVPSADTQQLESSLGQDLTFHTILYLEGDASRGNLEPRLIGFLHPADRRFFNIFTTVKGIGPRTALRALSAPVGEIARAIESKDARTLVKLDGIGKRTAELIIAQLSGKVQDFATGYGEVTVVASAHARVEEEAIAGLMALGERRPEAEALLDLARQARPELKTPGDLLREMLRIRTTRG